MGTSKNDEVIQKAGPVFRMIQLLNLKHEEATPDKVKEALDPFNDSYRSVNNSHADVKPEDLTDARVQRWITAVAQSPWGIAQLPALI